MSDLFTSFFLKIRWKAFRTMMGRRAGIWMLLNVGSSLALAGIELLFAFFLVHILYLVGLSGAEPALGLNLPPFLLTRTASLPLFIGLGLLRVLARVFNSQSIVYFGELIHCRLRFIFFELLYGRHAPRFAQSDINIRLSEIFPKATTFCTGIGNFLSAASQAGFFVIVLFARSPLKALIGCGAIVILAPVIKATHRFVRGLSAHIIVDYENVQRSLVRGSRNWMLIRVLKTENEELGRLHEWSLATTQKSLRVSIISLLAAGLPEIVGIALVTGLIAVQYKLDPQPGSQFISFLYLFLRMVQSLAAVGSALGGLHSSFPAYTQAADFIQFVRQKDIDEAIAPLRLLKFQGSSFSPRLELKTFDPSRDHPTSRKHIYWDQPPSLKVEDLRFRYSGSDSNVFNGLTFEVPSGACVGITGQSGAGKSTLLAMILGILEPTSGRLLLGNGQEFLRPRQAQVPVGYVGAEPFLIEGSVKDNLLYGSRGEFSKQQMIDALIRAGFSEASAELDLFLESPISEDGEGLSTGQRQRLCLARALLASPKLLILDEVSANVDLLAEEKIVESVRRLRGHCTVVIVSHRAGMLEACSLLLDIENQKMRAQV